MPLAGSGRTVGVLAFAAGTAACFYVAWNVVWLARGQLPPSILYEFTGIPVATTGLGRSIVAASNGEILSSIRWNAFCLPILALYAASMVVLVRHATTGGRLLLPGWMGRAWLGVLVAAWVVKLAQGPTWW